MKKYVKLVMVMGLALLAQTTAVFASSNGMGEKESLKVAMPEISIVQEHYTRTTEGAISIGGGFQSQKIEIPQTYQEKNVGYMELEGVMSQTGGLMIYNIDVAPNQYLQVSMQQPALANVDYDLYVGDVDWNTGTFYPEKMSAYGTYLNDYATGRNTIDESVGIINTTGATKTYYIAVQSSVGVSSEPFTLKVALSTEKDAYETDESLFDNFYDVGLGEVPGRTLSSPIDRDWYRFTADKEMDLSISLGKAAEQNGFITEVYTLGTNNTLQLIQQVENKYSIESGSYYIRVYNPTQGYSNSLTYNMKLSDRVIQDTVSAKIEILELNSQEGKDKYVTYSEGRYFRAKDWLEVTGKVTNKDGVGIANKSVHIYWENMDLPLGQYTNNPSEADVITNNEGIFNIRIPLSIANAQRSYRIPGPAPITHYYDVSLLQVYPKDGTGISQVTPVYLFGYSMYGR